MTNIWKSNTAQPRFRSTTRRQAQPKKAKTREAYRKRGEAVNWGFEKVEQLSGNIGYLDFRFFADPEFAGDTLLATQESDTDEVEDLYHRFRTARRTPPDSTASSIPCSREVRTSRSWPCCWARMSIFNEPSNKVCGSLCHESNQSLIALGADRGDHLFRVEAAEHIRG